MKHLFTAAALGLFATSLAAEGDIAKGEKEFRKCKACHMIASEDAVIQKGGKTGPNLYGVVGRAAGSVDGYRYSSLMQAAGASGLVWDEASLTAFLGDPTGYLKEASGEGGRSKMSFKLRKGAEDVTAYLKSVGPVMEDADNGETPVTDEATDTAQDG